MLRWLVLSLCPTIYGQELVKAGLVLALLGGTRKGEGGGSFEGAAYEEAVALAANGVPCFSLKPALC